MDLSVSNRGFGTLWNINSLSPTSGTSSFLAAANSMRAEKSSSIPDLSDPELSAGTYEQRLARLRKLHANTDYSHMEPRDRDKLIIDRFRATFPDYTAILGGLYSMLGDNSVYGQIRDEAVKQVLEACPGFEFPMQGEARKEYQRYVWGYEGMSEDEIRAVVLQKNNGGTLADIIASAQELDNLGIDMEAFGLLSLQIRQEMMNGTERDYGYLSDDNPIRINAMIAYAKGYQISWRSLAHNLLEESATHTFKRADMSQEEAKRVALAEMESCLTEFLTKIGNAEGRYTCER